MSETKKETFKEFSETMKNRGDNEIDAFRHTLWSIKMTRELGPEKSKAFTDIHERNRPKQTKESLIMDLENNKTGRELALNPKNKDKSDVEIAREALRNGLLITQPPNIKGEFKPSQHRHNPLEGRGGGTATGNAYNKQRGQ